MAGFGDLSGLLAQAEEMRRQLEEARGELRSVEVEGHAASGAVTVVLTATLDVRAVRIDPALLAEPAQAERLAGLVAEALADAIETARSHSKERLRQITGDLPLPDLF